MFRPCSPTSTSPTTFSRRLSNGSAPPNEVTGRSPVTALALRIKPQPVAVVAGIIIGIFLVAGILQRVSFPGWAVANLDSEVSIATSFSAALLWLGSFWWLLVAFNAQPRSRPLWVWWLIVGWLALDEGNAIHERLERWTGVDWQLLYLPLLAVAGVTWALVVRRFRVNRTIVGLLVGAAGVWGIALVLELVQNWGGVPIRASIYDPTMIVEEILEMLGSLQLLIAAMLALRVVSNGEDS